MTSRPIVALAVILLSASLHAGQERVIRVPLDYGAPGSGPAPNFSPKGTQVRLTPVPADLALPADAARPAKAGTIEVGGNRSAWLPVLATADAAHPLDLCRLYIDRNRNGRFDDDGPALTATPTRNEKTGAWWSSIGKVTLSIPYPGRPTPEPYLVNFWIVRDGDAAPDVLRYSVGSWRTGKAAVNGIESLVAAMDANNDAVFDEKDQLVRDSRPRRRTRQRPCCPFRRRGRLRA